jgi:hypothetical protein
MDLFTSGHYVEMKSQASDLSYGDQRERINHPRIEEHLGVRLEKLGKYDIMDWREIPTDDSPLWNVEQKARNMTFDFCATNYKTALIGKNKIDYMKGGNGIVYFDFTDKLMYWVFDEEEYKTFTIEEQFVRHQRSDCVDKPSPVVHIPCSILKECPV